MLATLKWLNQENFALITDAECRHLLICGESGLPQVRWNVVD
jgi:hypothetical protein